MTALLVEDGRIIDRFERLINAEMAAAVEALTGISTETLREAPSRAQRVV